MATDEGKSQVFAEATDEDVRLANLGYQQGIVRWKTVRALLTETELKRSFGLFSMIGFAFCTVTSSVLRVNEAGW